MSCQTCKLESKFVCLICDQLYCLTHGEEHFSVLEHAVQLASQKTKSRINDNILKKALKIEKDKRIRQITSNTCLVISNLQQISQMQINLVKKANNVEELAVVNFDFGNHLLYLANAGMINKGIYRISNEEIAEINSGLHKSIEEFENLKIIQEINKNQEENKTQGPKGTN